MVHVLVSNMQGFVRVRQSQESRENYFYLCCAWLCLIELSDL